MRRVTTDKDFRDFDYMRNTDSDLHIMSQEEVTALVLDKFNIRITRSNMDQMMKRLWKTKRHVKPGYLQLSKEGFDILYHQLHIKAYTFDIGFTKPDTGGIKQSLPNKGTVLNFFSQNIASPYYIEGWEMIVFGIDAYAQMCLFMNHFRRHGVTFAINNSFIPIIYVKYFHEMDVDEELLMYIYECNNKPRELPLTRNPASAKKLAHIKKVNDNLAAKKALDNQNKNS